MKKRQDFDYIEQTPFEIDVHDASVRKPRSTALTKEDMKRYEAALEAARIRQMEQNKKRGFDPTKATPLVLDDVTKRKKQHRVGKYPVPVQLIDSTNEYDLVSKNKKKRKNHFWIWFFIFLILAICIGFFTVWILL